MKKTKQSIRYQLIRFGFYLTALALAILTLGTQIFNTYDKHQSLIQSLHVSADILGRNSAAAILFKNEPDAYELLSSLQANPNILQAALFLQDGTVLAKYAAKNSGGCQSITAPVDSVLIDDMQFTWCSVLHYHSVSLHGQRIGEVAIEYSIKPLIDEIIIDLMVSAIAIVITLTISLIIWRRLAMRITEPLRKLSELTRQVERSHDFSLRAEIVNDDEVGRVAENFNSMMEQLNCHHARLNDELIQRRCAEKRLNELAYYDNVTGLHNRHYFKERLEEIVNIAIQGRQNCAVLFIDLDGFKKVNDALGHDAGDELLRLVSRRLEAVLRSNDIICRLGGDEFAIITTLGVTKVQVEILAKRLISEFSKVYMIASNQLFVTASIGISLCPEQAGNMEALVRNADIAMYQAKENGKSCFSIYDPSSPYNIRSRISLDMNNVDTEA